MSKVTAGIWIASATAQLKKVGISSARLDALLLAEYVLKKKREYLLANQELVLTPIQLKALNKLLSRRLHHEPIAYITGLIEFYGREFFVNDAVLCPRPESETMIEMLKEIAENRSVIADIGTGSGCLAITTKLELPDSQVLAVDIDPNCLQVARQNAKKHQGKIKFLQGDLLQPLFVIRDSSFIILANLPYVPDKYKVTRSILSEPRIAVFGGEDGLDIYRKFWNQLENLKNKPAYVFTESLPLQHEKMALLAKNSDYKLKEMDGFIQLFIPKNLNIEL